MPSTFEFRLPTGMAALPDRAVNPFQIVERRKRFQLRKGRAIHSVHGNLLDAEYAALRYWLGPEAQGAYDEEFEI